MPLLSYDPMEDGEQASANLWNIRLSAIHDLLNGNIDAANLANNAVTTAKIANGAVTSQKLGFEKYEDDNGWLITDLGLVKLATKKRTFKVPQRAQGSGGYVTFDAGMETDPIGFNKDNPYNVIHMPYMTNLTNAATGNWILIPKDEAGTGVLDPHSQVSAFRSAGGTSQSGGEPGAVETWVIF